MGNRLKDMFDDSNQEYACNVSFNSSKHYREFLEAVRKATEEGVSSKVNGISGISLSVKDGDKQYPMKNNEQVEIVIVSPSQSLVNVPVDTDIGKRNLEFVRTNLKDKVVLNNTNGKGASYQITYDIETKIVNVDYKAVYEEAENLDELIEYYNTLYFFSKQLFRADVTNDDIETLLNFFLSSVLYFERLKALGYLLKVDVLPKNIKSIDNEDLFIERAYFCLIENKAIRIEQKVNSMDFVEYRSDSAPKDKQMAVVYLEKRVMTLLEKTIEFYVVNMAFNLLIDKEEHNEHGGATLFFKEDPDQPMYLVSKWYLDEKLAVDELEHGLNHKDSYLDARYLSDYIKDAHSTALLSKTIQSE